MRDEDRLSCERDTECDADGLRTAAVREPMMCLFLSYDIDGLIVMVPTVESDSVSDVLDDLEREGVGVGDNVTEGEGLPPLCDFEASVVRDGEIDLVDSWVLVVDVEAKLESLLEPVSVGDAVFVAEREGDGL